MKTLKNSIVILSLAISSFLLSSCEDSILGMSGSGSTVTNEISISDIDGVDLQLNGNIHLTQAEDEKLVIVAQQNIFDNILMKESNGLIEFEFDKKVRNHDGVDIYISLKTLSKVYLSGSGDIRTNNTFNLDIPLRVNLDGSGDINIQANSPEVNTHLTGSGDVHLQVVTEQLNASITGSGNYTITGSTINSDFEITGSGDFSTYEFITEKTLVDITGSGDIKVNVSDELNVNISGSGNVYYKGQPTIQSRITGSGNIRNAN